MAVSLDLERALSRRSSAWRGEDNALSRSFSSVENDEEALKWAALEKLPTYDRLRKSVLSEFAATGSFRYQNVDVTTLSTETRKKFIHRVLRVPELDNERFLSKFRERIERVGIELPTIEVRFEHLTVDADVHVGSRALPSVTNFVSNLVEVNCEPIPVPLWYCDKSMYGVIIFNHTVDIFYLQLFALMYLSKQYFGEKAHS